ncbi:CopG family ribbon-helix-helix protein [Candidatus Parvarchaeota archaeon]|nr:CopG family ribbon-helix-helix protein [Candidatus Parvarchaeota archaeon]
MAIISLSLEKELLEQVDRHFGTIGVKNRSDAFRIAARAILAEGRKNDKLAGQVEGVLIAMHRKGDEEHVTEPKHDFEDVVVTQVHTNMKGGKCLEIFVFKGDAKKVLKFYNALSRAGKTEFMKLVVP